MEIAHLNAIMVIILRELENVFRLVNEKLSLEKQREGGHFCLALRDHFGPPLLMLKVGEQTLARAERTFRLCLEKAKRLRQHPEHLTSSQSQDENLDQHGGAVLWGDLIFSFSGLSGGEEDEKLMLTLIQPSRWHGRLPNPVDIKQFRSIEAASREAYHPTPASPEL
ncbi:MAG: hypothetical protein A2556_00310 [Candidatus Vogelbacteria bacterium RIFOXYD2_FULL_44_9]|uniref:Uncharacterized protein n=1 Tax=Candidatus Vogelbacteria bacterium RIFOXYD2_FULL_44_9 TaxID=1802441 RepID=A0A1G2QMA6_9BACT|nr:MAG: hypothetical protein A2556_00310 [Candidatus Vogelbacteria bacterium RIFOXYD2_FULL_44_9]